MGVKRDISKGIKDLLKMYPILALSGPRQSGKTTFLRESLAKYRYVSLENPDNRKFATDDPKGFFKEYDKYVIFDEIQRVPHLFSYLQTKVDNDLIMGQFVISGSLNFHLMHTITQSLAGRVAIFKLFPFDFQELSEANLLKNDIWTTLIRGYYPALFDRNIPSKIFYNNYIQTYVQRDLTDLLLIKDLRSFRSFLALCATRAGQLLNLNSLARECGITQPTAKSWLSVLENSYIVFLLSPLHKNFTKRVIKTPKLYFYDTGLLCHLLKITDKRQVENHTIKGLLFENMMVAEFVKRNYHKHTLDEIWFWRDANGNEVDLITQEGFQINLFEIKATSTIMPKLFKGLDYVGKLIDNYSVTKSLVYSGDTVQYRTNYKIIPWYNFGK